MRRPAEGEAAFGPRSRRLKTSPGAISAQVLDLILAFRKELAGQGLDAGPHKRQFSGRTSHDRFSRAFAKGQCDRDSTQ